MEEFAQSQQLLPLTTMMRTKAYQITNPDGLYIRPSLREPEQGVMFLTGSALLELFYLQSVSIVDFLIEKYGTKKFTTFCRNLRDAKTLNEALSSTYRLKDIQELEEEWSKYIRTQKAD